VDIAVNELIEKGYLEKGETLLHSKNIIGVSKK